MNTIKVPFEVLINAEKKTNEFHLEQFDDFIFTEFYMIIYGLKSHDFEVDNIKLEIEWMKDNLSIVFTLYVMNEKCNTYQYIFSEKDISYGVVLKLPPADFEKDEEGMALDIARMIIFYLGYIMNYPREYKKERRSSHKYSKEHRISTSKNKIYLFDDILKYVSENYVPEKGHHNIQCECWEVRGHYRHYKSGKVVFVKSFKKGKNRAIAEPKQKEYYV